MSLVSLKGLNAIKNDNEAASWWMENYLYCCSESCNDWLSSIGRQVSVRLPS